ncbi:hydrogen gas-evolving membrane-bound hydrogenase subunit E [Clostridium formicaceticum]|uniref:Monovalent cation/H+ antiporter subunit B n=1 Tax=Clostridium formicaceticum TaxID=1497 RepID=A0AAC9RQ96_9CLOT|nr:hydrogen gas-evolving membrane-bound hydrogenase subunit E [Clostridium formicaceticum]AOY74848.1 hypothetical protein BJL90_02070 [Clostridium formicaceticum]ARE89245.1 putative monovalent cation/H+ antiporter subunit B [Clostridium formicaceticum]
MKKAIILLALGGLLIVMLSSIFRMPSLGDIENPAYNEVARHYLQESIDETHTPNIIASIITDYRAFDTLGETTVLFTSIAAVISVLKGTVDATKKKGDH